MKFNRYNFSAPLPLPVNPTWADTLLGQAGLYAILVYHFTSRHFRVLYFGESENVNRRACGTHEKLASWRRQAGPNATLYRALCLLPGSTRIERQQAESLLIASYNPPCNDKLSFNFGRLLDGSGGEPR